MALINATSFAGFLLLLYLSSFVLLAILRIATGISIQRVGYFSLRHISYTPKEGVRIDIRGLGLAVHRPSFAQPTWISLRFTELCVTLDPTSLSQSAAAKRQSTWAASDSEDTSSEWNDKKSRKAVRSRLWKRLTDVKEKLKRIHRKIHWLRMLDIIALDTSLEVVGVGSVSVASFTMAVHTRRKLLDRGRLFRHKKDPSGGQMPAEWMFTVQNVLLNVAGREPQEILDALSMNIHGLLYKDKEGLRDTSIAVKVGRLYVPLDDIIEFKQKSRAQAALGKEVSPRSPASEITFDDLVEELDRPGSREAAIVQTVADSKEFFSSILQSVQEVQLALSFIRFSKEVDALRQANVPLVMNVVTHEIGVDLHRLDSNSPAHRMYFSRHDIAHQALVAMISVSVTLDEDESKSNKIMYVPMATMTVRTTLPAKTMSFTQERDASERNSNVFFANLVVTSPSMDLTPQHMIHILAIIQKRKTKPESVAGNRHRLISRLLPRANIKISVHEPVVRFVLPVADPANKDKEDFDMIISAVSLISLDVESSHSQSGELLYSLASNFRLVSHRLYYQSTAGERHNLVTTDTMELKAQVSASSEVLVVVTGVLRSFSVLMVREEVSRGVYNILRHFRRSSYSEKSKVPAKSHTSAFLRNIPAWLLEFHFEGTNFSIEAAGIDHAISEQTRGVALELDSWTADYVAHRNEASKRPTSRRKRTTSVHMDEPTAHVTHLSPPTSPSRNSKVQGETDGRRLAVHVKSLQGFIIESLEEWESKPFMSIPRFEVAFSTARDMAGPIFHVNSHIRAIYIDFSLYRLYSIGVAGSIVIDALLGPPRAESEALSPTTEANPSKTPESRTRTVELQTIDVKVAYIQVKAHMPADPAIMLQVYDVAAGRHRWSSPFVRCHLIRLHSQSPHVKSAWARLVTMSAVHIDIRHAKKKTINGLVNDQSLEIRTDFIRLGVPHGLMMYKVFDNFVNTAKATQQLVYRFRTRTNTYILQKGPEGPKQIPRISVRTKALMFELEDDAFEWKLSNIYHTGRIEQKQRLAREAAFDLKARKLQEERHPRATSRRRTQSSRRGSRSPTPSRLWRSRSADSNVSARRGRSHSPARPHSPARHKHRPHKIRYDREGACAVSGSAKIRIDEARQKLQEHNARSWKTRIDQCHQQQNTAIRNIRKMFLGADESPADVDCHETVLGISSRPGLLAIIISDLHLIVDKPSFPMADLPQFMHEVGKGMPMDMKYSLLVPVNISLDMGEARFMLRDYPLNLLHVPAIRPGQPPRLPAWSLKTDFVIAEEFRDEQSLRHIKVEIIPKGQQNSDGSDIPGFSIDVRRTVSPVKTYSKPVIEINTSQPTSISWGTSYQPVIQDMMMIIEGFTKPEIDPSDRVGFWDKIRLSFHSRPVITWKGDGDIHLRLKGSRDPYVVTGYGAGFLMCWRNNVQWAIHADDNPKKFMTVRSGEFVLAIPDYSHQARGFLEERSHREEDSMNTGSTSKNSTIFKKVIMKVSGNVQWTAGLVFERDTKDGKRSTEFKPHYGVVLKNPKFIPDAELENYDAFRGFRSQHIHLSVSIAAPFDRDWTTNKSAPSDSYNSVHLSPRFFSHFFDWWSLFSGIMSLPIRQGTLWRGPEKTSKKFGRHLSTIKYGLLLSPLFIAHVYKHKDPEDYQEDLVSATGLKLRLNSFILDVHQRREYFDTLSKGKTEQTRTSGMRINKAELDFIHADLRAVSSSIAGTSAEALKRANPETLASFQENVENVDMSKFTIPDHDFSWIDMDDLVELDWVLPVESVPESKILPLAFTPRFTYFRQTDHEDGIHGDATRTSPFGDEDTHECVMSRHHNDPREVQMELIRSRLEAIEDQLNLHVQRMGESELKVVREGQHNETLREAHDSLILQQHELEGKRTFLKEGLSRLAAHAHPGEAGKQHLRPPKSDGSSAASVPSESQASQSSSRVDIDGLYSAPQDEFASDFNNRFIVHNAQVKWNNSLRNIILRYSHQVGQRRGFVYYMSRRAVKFIIDIVEEQAKKKSDQRKQSAARMSSSASMPAETPISPGYDEPTVVQDRIEQLLQDGRRFIDAEEETAKVNPSPDSPVESAPNENIAEDFQPMNSYHVRLIAPQVQLQSEKNTKSVVLLTAKGMQLKVVAIMDKARLSDEVSGLVQRRFALDMDGVQIFVTNQKRLSKYLHLYSGNRYGNSPGSSWPPWASIEAMFDFHLDPFGFQRVIQKTSASLRYDKYNPLRLKYNEEVANKSDEGNLSAVEHESRIDHLSVDFPRLRASCDSQQYYTMYIIVLDLLMYSEPLEKTRTERLEKIMLATDFSDLRGAPEMADRLQERIRQLEEIKAHFQIHAKYLDRQGWQDRIDVEKDLANCENELFFIMKAINTSQQRNDERKSSQSTGFLRWYLSASEVVWHLMRSKDDPLLEFQMGDAAYERIDNSDGSNNNALEISRIRGWNLLPNAIYPEIIGPYHEPGQSTIPESERKMLKVHWYMLEAIAGIPVVEHFQVNMHPLKVQLESELGKQLFEYIFPSVGSNAFDNGGFSPLMVKNMKPMDEDGDEDEEGLEAQEILTPQVTIRQPTELELRSSSPGAMGRRMQPTYNLNYNKGTTPPGTGASTPKLRSKWGNHSNPFKRHDGPSKIPVSSNLSRRASSSSLTTSHKGRADSVMSNKDDDSKLSRSSSRDHRFALRRVNSDRPNNKKSRPSDDLSQMMARASNYMTIAHIKLNSFVICLSYKGKADRNWEDLHDFVFRLPTLEYRNKTWSNLDLALRLKKDVIKALISHTGAIIGNKFSHGRPNKKQQDRWREIAIGSTLIPNGDTLANSPTVSSETTSLYSFQHSNDPSPRISTDRPASRNGTAPLLRSGSWASIDGNGSKSQLPLPIKGRGNISLFNGNGPTYGMHGGHSTPRVSSSADSRIDPLGPISPPRPTTGHSSTPGMPSRSLLKETFNKHFPGGETIKGRVRFMSGSGDKDREKDKEKEDHRSGGEEDDNNSEADTESGSKRKNVLALTKKVLGRSSEK